MKDVNSQQSSLLERQVEAIRGDEPRFNVKYKDESRIHRLLTRIFPVHGDTTTFIYPNVWFQSREEYESMPQHSISTLQHEWVHIKDAVTFFGLSHIRLRLLNVLAFYTLYVMPQLFGIISLVCAACMLLCGCGISSAYCLIGLIFLLPWPSPGRTFIEMRAYRRSHERGAHVLDVLMSLTSSTYYFTTWARSSMLYDALKRSSPYRDEMDDIIKKFQ